MFHMIYPYLSMFHMEISHDLTMIFFVVEGDRMAFHARSEAPEKAYLVCCRRPRYTAEGDPLKDPFFKGS